MTIQHIDYLNFMGIPCWQAKTAQPMIDPVSADEWQTLRTAVAGCQACGLDRTRTQTVFGVGNVNAELMVIGEAPGFYEDQKGEPFVGRAGQLLDEMLQAIELDRTQVYIANILKCRPPNNRDPQPEEVASCTPFLLKQIALIKPKLLLAVGRIAGHFLLNTKNSLGQMRGKVHEYGALKTPLIITYHPAYLLRSPSDKGKAYRDLLMARELIEKI